MLLSRQWNLSHFQGFVFVNGRAFAFVMLSSLVMMAAVILQGMFNPPKPQMAADADPAAVVQPDDAAENKVAAESDDDSPQIEKANSLAEPKAEFKSDADDSDSAETPVEPPANEDAGDADTDQEKPLDEESGSKENIADDSGLESDPILDSPHADLELIKPATAIGDEFVTFGSLAADSGDRYLITANLKGGTIRRVELNFRNRKGRLKYRDLEYQGGYLGCLECIDTPAGCLVRAVGDGTPAQVAGIKVGDILVSMSGEPITSSEDFEARMAKKTKPRTTVELQMKRDGETINVSVMLADKPIELLQNDTRRLDPNFDYPESFVLSLLKPSPFKDQAWPDIDDGMRVGAWALEPTAGAGKGENLGESHLAFRYQISAEALEKLELAGPLTVIKRFRMPKLSEAEFANIDSHTFHFDLDIEIRNESEQSQTIAYELDGPTGTPSETWWYANKIHGRSTAIGYVAGARDVIGSTSKQPFLFFGGPEIVKGSLKSPPTVYYICNPLLDDPRSRELNYVGIDTQYFYVSLIPKVAEGEKFVCNSVTLFPTGGMEAKIPKDNAHLQKLVDVTFYLVKSVKLNPGETYRQSFEIFSGPKEPEALVQYGLDDARTFGWFAWCSKPLLWLLHFFYWITFSFSYGLAIVMLTVLVRSLMIPISRKAALNAQMMQHLQPQMKEIADKYKDDMEKRAAAQRELFKSHNYNPMGGCFMMLFQLPIFLGLYRGLSVDIELRDQPLIPGMNWSSNLSGPDQFLYWKDWMPGWLADETGWLGPYLNILPLVTMVLFLVQQKMFMPPATDDQQKMMQKMMTFMMIFMGVLFFKVAAGLCIYFITSSIWGILERKLLPKPVLNTDKLPIAGTLEGGTAKTVKPPTKNEQKAARKQQTDLADRKRRNSERAKRLKERG